MGAVRLRRVERREIGFIGTAPIVIGTPRADCEAHGERFEFAQVIAGQFQTLDVHGESGSFVSDVVSESPTALGQMVTDARACGRLADGVQQGISLPEPYRIFGHPGPVRAFHREGNGATHADRVESQFVAEVRRFRNDFRIGDSAQRAQCKDAFVLEPYPGRIR